jgi:nitroreductase
MGTELVKAGEHRKTEHDISPILLNRWSPRAMSGESLQAADLMPLFEAARWAPSSYNGQPWRFVFATRDSEAWPSFLDVLVPGNREWAQHAGALIIVCSRKNFEHNGKPSITHSFDTGAANENLLIQGCVQGLVVHPMQGFDYDAARELIKLPDDHTVEAMVAVGRPGDVHNLPEAIREREVPSGRKPVSQIAFEDAFQG